MALIDPNERKALLRLVLAERRTVRESVGLAALYAGQLLACTALLMSGYDFAGKHGAMWATVSAALVLQPGLHQALGATLVRIAANVVGGTCGVVVTKLAHGAGLWQLLVAMTACVFICEVLLLDLGLRTACVSVLIVMYAEPGHVVVSGLERLAAVTIGCVTGVAVQVASNQIVNALGRIRGATETAPVMSETNGRTSEG